MSDFLRWDLHLDAGDVVALDSDTQGNVMLLSDLDFSSYRSGRAYRYFGGFFRHFPAHITAPSSGHWYVVFDLGGRRAAVHTALRVIKAA
jgi:hypothetical protein